MLAWRASARPHPTLRRGIPEKSLKNAPAAADKDDTEGSNSLALPSQPTERPPHRRPFPFSDFVPGYARRMPLAIVREVPHSFADCLTTGAVAPDPGLARRQHLEYRARLEAGGFEVIVLPGDDAHPDSPFIEDTAVVFQDRALATRPGHPSRRGEVGPVAAALRRWCRVEWMREPATLDGGDVLRLGRRVFVGRSARTNAAGIAALERFARSAGYEVVPVRVLDGLHLKSGATGLDDDTVLIAPGAVDPSGFAGLRVVEAAGSDPHRANVVRLADGTLLVAAAHAEVAVQLAELGRRVAVCDVSEFAAADGGLTCLSIRVR